MKQTRLLIAIITVLLSVSVTFAQQAFPPRPQTLQDAQSTGNGSELNVTGYSVVTLEIVGSEAGTDRVVTFEAWQDVTASFAAIQCANQGTRVVGTTLTASGVTAFHIQCDVAGMNRFRAPVSGGATGNVTVTATAISNSSAGITAAVTTPASGVVADVNVEQWNNQTVTGGAGVVTAGTPRVTLASDDPAVTALQVIDDWDESDRAKVNVIVGQAGITAGAGVVAANTPRTTLASDDPAVVALQIIDDWDETNRAAVNTIAGQVGVQGGAGVVTALTQRVALATDANTIQGTVTANQGTNNATPWNENVAQIAGTATATGNGVVGAGVQRVAIASDNTAYTVNIGTFPDNEPFNVAQINGVTPLMGNGVTGTGSQRVTVASDNTPFPVKIDQTTPGTTNRVDVGTFPDNEPFNLNQLAGTALAVPFDADTGAGTQNLQGMSLRKAAAGGSVEYGTATDPLRNDPTGTTAQPASQSGTWTVQPGNTANTTAWKVDGSAVTQPVSAASLPLPSGASTAAKQPALGIAGTANADVITVQGIAGMTKVLVTPDSVALPANQSVNVAQVNGVAPLMGNGITGTGSQRVTIASDNTAFPVNAAQSGIWTVQPGNTANTTPWLATISQGGNTANVSVNNTLKVALAGTAASEGSVLINTVAPGDAISAQTGSLAVTTFPHTYNGATFDRIRSGIGVTGVGVQRVVNASDDPCQTSGQAKSSIVVNVTADAQLIAISGSTVIYVCSFSVSIAGTTPTMRLISGTGAVCATGFTGRTGAYAPLTGSMITAGSGSATIIATAAGEALCMDTEGTSPSVQGLLSYVQK